MKISALILAGGQGSRFGYQDKGLIEWNGRWLVQHVIASVQQQTDNIIISCNRNKERYASLGFPLVEDPIQGYQGPLAGIDAAIRCCTTDYLFICPCDCPLLPPDLITKLYDALRNSPGTIAVVDDGIRQQNLLALWNIKACRKEFAAFLRAGGRAVKAWYRSQPVIQVDCSMQAAQLINVNSQQELDNLPCTKKSS